MNTKKIAIICAIFVSTLLIISLLFNASNSKEKNPPPYPKTIVDQKPRGGDFTLTTLNGQHSLSDDQGKLVLLYFGYTYCPDVCPTDLGNLAMAYHGLSEQDKPRVQILFITVDPKRDTATRMAEFSRYFDANIIGLTGATNDIARIAKKYGVAYARADMKDQSDNYVVDHSAFVYIIDQNGQLQTQLPHATPPKQIQKHIKNYLQ